MTQLDDYGFEVFEQNEFPLAYLITIRTFGTWLPGDERGSITRNQTNIYGMPRNEQNKALEGWIKEEMKFPPKIFSDRERNVVESSIVEICERKAYLLRAMNVRTNHAHVVLSAQKMPERIIIELKANATKMLRESGLAYESERIWSRGKSRRYLWKPRNVDAAISYVLYGQGERIFVSEDWENFEPPSL